MKKVYEKLGMTPLEISPEESFLLSSITADAKVTVQNYKDGFGGTLDDPGLVNLTFE